MKIINLTPHQVTLVNEKNDTISQFESEGSVRLDQITEQAGSLGGIPITRTTFGESKGLPEEVDGVFYIVSRLVLSAHPERDDLLVPNELVRNDKGHIIGCKSLSTN